MASFPGDALLDQALDRVPPRVRPLAKPPAGSGLRPIFGDKGLPLVGKTLTAMRKGPDHAVESAAQFGPVSWSRVFGQDMVFVVGPDAVQEVLVRKAKSFSQSGWEYLIGPFFNRGLMLLDGQEHRMHRHLMQGAFTRPRLEGYLAMMGTIMETRLAEWPVGEPVLMYPAIKRISLDIATRVFMGTEPTEETRHLSDAFQDCVHAGTSIIRTRLPGAPWLSWNKGLRGRARLEDFFRSQIADKRASDDEDLFAALCHLRTEDGTAFTDEDVVNHMIFLMMAAHDTSSTTATAVAYYLAKHPEWQERCRRESRLVGPGPVDLATVESLETLHLVFLEAMRLVAPVPALVRRSIEDVDLLGCHVPAGTITAVLPGAMHLLPELYADAAAFDPTRFAEPRLEQKQHRHANVPFGGGAHKCIGMYFGTAEVKALVHRMLLEFRLELPDPEYVVTWDQTSLFFPVDGLPVILRKL